MELFTGRRCLVLLLLLLLYLFAKAAAVFVRESVTLCPAVQQSSAYTYKPWSQVPMIRTFFPNTMSRYVRGQSESTDTYDEASHRYQPVCCVPGTWDRVSGSLIEYTWYERAA